MGDKKRKGLADQAPPEADALTCQEAEALERHEAAIPALLRASDAMGEALRDIRDRRLYRQTHPDFPSYCRRRWRKSSSWADRLINDSAVLGYLKSTPIGVDIPESESLTRELTRLRTHEKEIDAGAVVQVWRAAVENARAEAAPMTPKRVRAEVDAHLGVVKVDPPTELERMRTWLLNRPARVLVELFQAVIRERPELRTALGFPAARK